jgi:hypothetical protein
VQGADLADGVVGQGQSLGFPGLDVYLGEEEFGHGVAHAVVLAVAAYCAGGELLGGVEPAQVELDHCGLQIGVPVLERVLGCPPVVCLSEAAGGLVGAAEEGVGGCGLSGQSCGDGR